MEYKLNDFISLEDFSKIAGVSEKTIIKNYKKIPLIRIIDGQYRVLRGTRYLAHIYKYKINDNESKRYVILDCISKEKYVDNVMLGLYEESFIKILGDLLSADLIRYNENGNHYGTNAFDITPSGNKILRAKRNAIIDNISKAVQNIVTNVVVNVICNFAGEGK
mgnify:CR=1 FL=1